ncbi:MAG: DODA-type extradiol aromatic ring-opening family dioxygenase [Elainella sp.]
MQKFPTLFISHGAPTVVIDPALPGKAMQQLGQQLSQLARPEAILVISAHWGTAIPTVSDAAQPETIHDFSGFPPELYSLHYPAVGAPELASQLLEHLIQAGLEAAQQPHGLDHGAWIPLHLMFPQADIPVLQLSIQPRLDPVHHWQVGAALQPLRDRLLIIGSGQITHNLRALDYGAAAGPANWTQEFTAWMQQQIETRNRESLINYRQQAPHAIQAHPTEEHLLPLFTALGAAGPTYKAERLDWGVSFGTLAWDSYLLFEAVAETGSEAKMAASC